MIYQWYQWSSMVVFVYVEKRTMQAENKRYTVITAPTPRGPVYQILDKMTGAVIESAYTCEKWAEREAERMEKENGEAIHHGIPKRTSRVSVGNKDTTHKTKNS